MQINKRYDPDGVECTLLDLLAINIRPLRSQNIIEHLLMIAQTYTSTFSILQGAPRELCFMGGLRFLQTVLLLVERFSNPQA